MRNANELIIRAGKLIFKVKRTLPFFWGKDN